MKTNFYKSKIFTYQLNLRLLILSILLSIKCTCIEILQLEPNRWREYKNFRLKTLKEELPHVFGIEFKEESIKPDNYWKNILFESLEMKNRWLIFAQKNNQIVGTLGAFREWDNYLLSNHIVCLTGVYVLPAFRGQGIATMLMKHLMATLENDVTIDHIMLWVTFGQSAAINLYKKFGFKISGFLSKALKVNNTFYDNYLMEKSVRH